MSNSSSNNTHNKKVGILTYSQLENLNFGAIIQSFATYHTLEKLGYTPFIIDWTIKKRIRKYEIKKDPNKSIIRFIFQHVKRFLNYRLYLLNRRVAIKRGLRVFEDFSNTYLPNKTRKVTLDNINSLNNDLNYFIVGSDQVWRYNYCPDIKTFFLNFVNDSNSKIAYAASFGLDQWSEAPEEVTTQVKSLAKRFNHISVREKSGVDICKNVFDVEATHVLDPTMLISADEYLEIFKFDTINNKFQNSEFFSYFFLGSHNDKAFVSDCQSKLGLQPVNLHGSATKLAYIKFPNFNSVPDWLNIIRNSKFVVTDSFHCTVFSILFNRNFAVLLDEKRGNSRLQSLLTEFGLESRMFASKDEFLSSKVLNIDVDYSNVNKILKNRREFSLSFLINSLKNK